MGSRLQRKSSRMWKLPSCTPEADHIGLTRFQYWRCDLSQVPWQIKYLYFLVCEMERIVVLTADGGCEV